MKYIYIYRFINKTCLLEINIKLTTQKHIHPRTHVDTNSSIKYFPFLDFKYVVE